MPSRRPDPQVDDGNQFRSDSATSEALQQRGVWIGYRRAQEALPALLEVAPTVGSRQAMRLFLDALGIEARSPFLDRRMIELAMSLPSALLLDARRSKAFLRRALEGRAPVEVVEQPKSNRLYAWFQARGLEHPDALALGLRVSQNPTLSSRIQSDLFVRAMREATGAAGDVSMSTAEQLCAVLTVARWLDRLAAAGIHAEA